MGCTVRVNTVLVMYNDYATVGICGLIYCMYLYMIYDIYIVCLVCERGVECQYDDGWSYIWALGTTFFDRIQLYIQDIQDDIGLPHEVQWEDVIRQDFPQFSIFADVIIENAPAAASSETTCIDLLQTYLSNTEHGSHQGIVLIQQQNCTTTTTTTTTTVVVWYCTPSQDKGQQAWCKARYKCLNYVHTMMQDLPKWIHAWQLASGGEPSYSAGETPHWV